MTKLIGKIESDEVDINVTILGAGPQGEPGLSAYEVAVANGFEGDVETWLASLATGGMTQADVEALVTSLLPEVPDVSDFVTKTGILTDTEIQEALKGERGEPGVQGEPGRDGAPGADGKDGAPGRDGLDGSNGADGIDGFSPVISVADNTDESYTLAITDKNGTIISPNLKGADGKDGTDGIDGTNGHTPIRGTDYWTEADQTAIVADVLAALPNGDGVSY